MYLDVYVGFFDGSFDENGYSNIGNSPKRQSPFFPDGSFAFRELKKRISDGAYVGKQVDWGAWVAKVSKQQIKDFMSDMYTDGSCFEQEHNAHIKKDYLELIAFVADLDDEGEYALVASEL
jgi:hypothetical protein